MADQHELWVARLVSHTQNPTHILKLDCVSRTAAVADTGKESGQIEHERDPDRHQERPSSDSRDLRAS